MNDETDKKSGPSRRLLLAGAAAVAVGTGAVYGIRGIGGNSGSAGGCADAARIAEQAAPFARGEVAGFIAAKSPVTVADLAFRDAAGAERSLADFSGKTVLLNLWATWCAPCRHEMPSLDRLQARLGGDAFEVVAVSIDTGSPENRRNS